MESFEEQWAKVVAMTQNCPFITGKPVIHTSGSMSTVKEGFWRQHGVSFIVTLFGVAAFVPIIPGFRQDSDISDMNMFLILLLGVLCLYFGIVRILTVRRLCWNGNAAIIYLHYGWLWNRHIFQIPRESIHIKMSVAGERKWSSSFNHGDTILSLELKNRAPVSGIRLLADSSRDLTSFIARLLSATFIDVEDSTMAQVCTDDGRTIRFPKTGIGSGDGQLPTMRLCLRGRQAQKIIYRMPYQLVLWVILIVFGYVVFTIMVSRADLKMYLIAAGCLLAITSSVVKWFSFFGTSITIDSEKAEVIIRQGLFGRGLRKMSISFGQIIGIQICPRHVKNEGSSTVFELNLVIRDVSDVDRINLLAQEDDEKILSCVRQIAAAMNKPIFDHSMIKKKTLADTIIL